MDIENLSCLVTEKSNPRTVNIDQVSTIEMVRMINNEDKTLAFAVEKSLDSIASAVDVITERLKDGGRLFYIGAGTSGRLGIVDASECPPTFGVDDELVQGIIAGGKDAIFKAVEGTEDNAELGERDLKDRNITSKDVVCGIAASGRTPYVIGAMKYAKGIGAAVICITMNPDNKMIEIADVPICVTVGPEVIMGSTRMKAGTAQKMVLNMLTTCTMVKLGKVYKNYMVDLQASNEKLIARAKKIVMEVTNCSLEEAEATLEKTNYNVKLSITMIMTDLDKEDAEAILKQADGRIQKAIDIKKGM